MKLLKVDSLTEARKKIQKVFNPDLLQTEELPYDSIFGRILAEDIVCHEMLPHFRRSTVDGYAVIAKDTQGASDSIPVFLDIVEEVEMGKAASATLCNGQCAYVPTGGMLPEGADAMVMVEYSELFADSQVALYDSVSAGRNVVQIGEDIEEGTTFITRGSTLRAQEVGAMAAAGILTAKVYRPLRITILSSGDELVEATVTPAPGQVRDINTIALKTLAEASGFEVVHTDLIVDDETRLKAALSDARAHSDIIAVSGGSSQGKKDMTSRLIDEIADEGVFTHGLALKPGKPTILGYDHATNSLFAGLPGHPVAAMMVFKLLLAWLKHTLFGEASPRVISAVMETNVAGAPGRDTCLLTELLEGPEGYIARPVFGKSGLISTLTRAEGYIIIDMNAEGLKAGEAVSVHLL